MADKPVASNYHRAAAMLIDSREVRKRFAERKVRDVSRTRKEPYVRTMYCTAYRLADMHTYTVLSLTIRKDHIPQ